MANPLDPVMSWYEAALDSIRVTQRVLNQNIAGAVTHRHIFYGQPPADCVARLDAAKDELARVAVVALTAIFERTLRDYLTQLPRSAWPPGDPHRDAVREGLVRDIEYWNISDRVLEVFPVVASQARGLVKQIIEYRNWVAHGHTLTKPAPTNVTPDQAHKRLSDFLIQSGVITP
jgi:hypothetical protein